MNRRVEYHNCFFFSVSYNLCECCGNYTSLILHIVVIDYHASVYF